MSVDISGIDSLLSELSILAEAAQMDFEHKFWPNYERYIVEFNRILGRLHGAGFITSLAEIAGVPDGQRAAYGTGSDAEQAKLREIAYQAKILLARTRQLDVGRSSTVDAIERVERICSRFQIVARQLRDRHGERATLEIEDEYDVQDLLHALLRIDFEDVRVEEWTPSYAGGSARMDFLLKKEQLVIEVKKTRRGLAHKEVGDQLIVDIERYKNHQDCKLLVCFVYDPESRVGNPRGLEADLESRSSEKLTVKALICPS